MATGDKLVSLDGLKAAYDTVTALAAPTETGVTAAAAHAAGSYFILGGALYQATEDIASGGTITPGTNCQTVPNGLGGDVSDLKSATNNRLLTDEVKIALLACIQNLAWAVSDGQDYYDALNTALNPPQDFVSITAVFNQSGPIYTDTPISTLRGSLVVTAHYSDSSSSTIYAYTLSGTLTEGTSVITVAYGGKTTTFNVTVTDNTLLYELPQATTFNGSSVIDTEVTLIPTDRDFTVLLDFTPTSTARQFAFYAGYQGSPYYGVGLECQKNTSVWGAMGYNSYINLSNITTNMPARVAIRHSAGSGKINAICWANDTLSDGEVSVTIVSPNNMLIGAYGSNSALGFIGTITEFRAYTRYFSDNDAMAYVMGGNN